MLVRNAKVSPGPQGDKMNVRLSCVLLLGATMSVACWPSQPSKLRGCADRNALNYNSSAEEDDGSCQFSRVAFYGGLVIPPGNLPVSVKLDGAAAGQITGFYPVAPPGNCSADFTAQIRLSDGARHDWNATSAGGVFAWAGTVQANRSQECIVVRVF